MKQNIICRIQEFTDTNRPNRFLLKRYLLRDGKAHKVAIVCPGGGYRRVCSFIEGRPFVKKLNRMGYHAFVLYYRVKDQGRYPHPQEDLARAVRELQDHAQDWKLDMEGYSVWGSSAGGHLAASFGTESMGYAKFGLPKPGAIVLSYPVVTMEEKTHAGSRDNLLGENPSQELKAQTSVEQQVTGNYPPTFLWVGSCDSCVDPDNSRLLHAALDASGVPHEFIEYPGVEHGVGVGEGLPCEGWFEKAVAFWHAHTK